MLVFAFLERLASSFVLVSLCSGVILKNKSLCLGETIATWWGKSGVMVTGYHGVFQGNPNWASSELCSVRRAITWSILKMCLDI